MRFLKSLPLLIGLGLLVSTIPTPAEAGSTESYKVELNKTEIVRLPGAAASVIIGNPKIADVTVQSSDLLFVVGRGYGETNLIILDSKGNTMMNADLQVINALPKTGVRLYNGKNRETYSCIPYCGPSPVLGDDTGFIGNNTSVAEELNTFPAFTSSNPTANSSSNQFDFDEQTAGGAFSSQSAPSNNRPN
jgi:hypothetical protein